jgi:hypothetical protein
MNLKLQIKNRKKFTKLICAIIFIQCCFHFGYGQEITIGEGSFKILFSEKNVALQFTFDSLQVGKYKVEADYVNKKVTEMNKKQEGKGDEWAREWIAQRKENFEPAFTDGFKNSSGLQISQNANYTLIFHTTYIEQGFSTSGIMVHKNPEVRGELILVETLGEHKIIAKANLTKAMGKAGPHFETGDHVDEAYFEAGSAAGPFVINN